MLALCNPRESTYENGLGAEGERNIIGDFEPIIWKRLSDVDQLGRPAQINRVTCCFRIYGHRMDDGKAVDKLLGYLWRGSHYSWNVRLPRK